MSTQYNHTAGPWYWKEANTQQHLCADGVGSFAQISMPIPRKTFRQDVHGDAARAKYEANARLISAAPELLATLNHILRNPKTTLCIDDAEMICAAVNKATGGQS